MSQDRLPIKSFRRRLLHQRSKTIASLLSSLPSEGIEANEFNRSALILGPDDVAVLLLDRALHGELASPPPEGLGEGAERVGVIVVGDRAGAADPFWPPRVYFSISESAPEHHLARAVRSVFRFLEERAISARSRRALAERTRAIENLNSIGISLAAETDPQKLIREVLFRARDLTQADAGSLYLIETGDSGLLRFQAAQNDSIAIDFEEHAVPIDTASIAGYVASTGAVLRLDDVYRPPADAPYRFNRSWDEANRYRTKSMLVVPMKNAQGRVIGILQLMNRKRHVVPDLSTTAMIRRETVPFDDQNEEIARSLASQAAVALENARLTEHLKRLFEGFVAASVTAIEQRDPTTSGHSERVAVLTCALAEATGKMAQGLYADFQISPAEMMALRYAAVLHDFGKVGVREWVLVKAKKLPPGRLELLAERFEKARFAAAARVWEKAARQGLAPKEARAAIVREIRDLDVAWELILEADQPTVLEEETASRLEQLRRLKWRGSDSSENPLVLPDEEAYLGIGKGSLNPEERREIESHVTQTYRFLSRIPWTPELSRVPELAYLHHEKLNGSGYPRGLKADDLPPPARMMTICDMYDALSAADRPYKRAVAPDGALDILRAEAARGALDFELLSIFIDTKTYEATAAWRRTDS
jgi:HD-GYP domain-containing protein (c-di-GMP phosphodiesterase class II)